MSKGARSRLVTSLVLGASIVALVSAGGCSSQPEEPVEHAKRSRAKLTTSIPASGDSHVRSGSPNQNYGSTTTLRLQASGDNRALVRFDSSAVSSLAPDGTVTLKLTIVDNGENWSPQGRAIAVHRLTTDWTELGATWNCAVDTNSSNSQPDCSGATAWEMGKPQQPELHPWVAQPTATAVITNGSTGVVSFDVSADIALFRAGTPNYGFLIKKVEEGLAGRVEFASRETSTPPVLEVACTDDDDSGTCDPADAGDGGTSTDGGAPPEDSGSGQQDSGGGQQDSGGDPQDSGSGQQDSGGGQQDSGPVCVPESCDDGQECTLDECTASGCVHAPAPVTASCSDGNACSTGDHCDGLGACAPGPAVTCTSPGPCATASCDPAVGCTTAPLPAGTSCESDGDVCTGASTCDGLGGCQPGTPLECVSSNPCLMGTCDPTAGCLYVPAPAGTSCGSPLDMCSGAPTCDGAGVCRPAVPVTCSSNDACQASACDPAVGCVVTPVADGTPCDADMNACNGVDRCQAGACIAGASPSCTSSDPCLIPSCHPLNGCTLTPAPNGTPGCVPTLEPPPLDPTVPMQMATATAFLYSGSAPVQTGVAAGAIDAKRVGVVRGRVLDADGSTPKSGAIVTIVGHPELGQTVSRDNGEYDLAVNGGTTYVVNIARAGYITLQRPAQLDWHGWAVVDDVVLTQPHTSPDLFVTGSATPQVVRGLVTPAGEDADGARQATLVFPENTHITNFAVPDGTPLEVQLTEFTRGAQGLERMPGALPPTSGYTYAFEATLPAATAAGVSDVQFDRDVSVYVDNFTHYPVGETVPLGFYDRGKGAWMAEKSGRILKVLTVTGGAATIDVTGDGVADTGTALSNLGITTSELQTLAAEYPAGKELWRVTMRHFSPWDCNWGFGLPADSEEAPDGLPRTDHRPSCDESNQAGSIIGCESRRLGEVIPVVGTPFSLRYESDRVPGYLTRYTFRISDASPPRSEYYRRARIEVRIAGRRFADVRSGLLDANEEHTWRWDGRDAYGRDVGTGTFRGLLRVGYEYAGVTRSTGGFASVGGAMISGDRAARTLIRWKETPFRVERTAALPFGLGGWTLDAQHVADVDGKSLRYGDGTRRSVGSGLGSVIETIAGGGTNLYATGPARQADLTDVHGLARGPDGSWYVGQRAYSAGGLLRRIGPDGTIATLAGVPPTMPKVDGGDALHAQVWPIAVALGPDGSLYFAEYWGTNGNKHQVWKISPGPNPTLHLVAGSGTRGQAGCPAPWRCGDGGDARSADLAGPSALAVGADGTLFIADYLNNRVRRVGPEGNISTYFEYPSPVRLSLRPDGVLYVQDWYDYGVGRFEPDGTWTVFRGVIGQWCGGGGWQSMLGVALADGSLLIPCVAKIVQRTPDGRLVRLAGREDNYDYGFSGDGGPALAARLRAEHLVVGEDGEILFYDYSGRIRRLRPPFAVQDSGAAFGAPTEDGREVHEFDASGRHLRTSSGLTGSLRFAFGYDPSTNQLTSIRDEANNETRITRAPGAVTITAPHGQVTTLRIDEGSGYLLGVTNPVTSEVTNFGYAANGLLTSLTDPRNHSHLFEYDADRRLLKDTNALPGSNGTRLSTTFDLTGWTVDHTSPEDRVTRYRTTHVGPFADSAIIEQRTTTVAPGPNELSTVVERYADGATRTTSPDGTKVSVLSMAADPRLGTMASFPSSVRTDVGYPTTTHSMTRTESRSATLATPGNPFSVTAQTITTTLSGAGLPNATTTRVFAAGPPASWTTTSPAGRQSRATLDSLDRVTSLAVLGTDPVALHPLQYHYDARGRIDQITHGTRVYTTSYDPATGWVESTSDPAHLGVSYAQRDANGRPQVVNLPGGRALAMSYDLGGNVVSITPPSKPAHAFSWDEADRVASYAPPSLDFLPKDTTYARDHDGLLLEARAPETRVLLAHDELGRTREVTDVVTKSLTYDSRGRLTTIASTEGVMLTYGYDGALVTQQAVSGPFSHAVNKTYDNFLRLATWNVDGTAAASPTYDSDGLVTAMGGLSVTRGTTGLLKSTTLGAVTDAFAYNAFGEVIGHTVTGSATGYSASYARDAAGRIETKTETLDGVSTTRRYTYDAAGRLWQIYVNGAPQPAVAYHYDANGNREDGTYDAQDRQVTQGGFTRAYGPNGELAKKTQSGTLAETHYSYDVHGNLRAVVPPSPLAAVEYVIDGLNRRVGKKVGGSLVQGFVYDGPRVVAELDASGAVVSVFYYVVGGHSPDFMRKNGVTYRFVKDHLGSPRLVVETSTGAVAQRMDFDEWGVVLGDSNPGFQPFGFAGGLWDRDTGLVRFGARDYEPATGRWTTKDASRFGGGLNFYAYAENDPVNLIDPTGFAYAPAGPPSPFRAAAQWLYQASARNFMHAGDRWDGGNYGGAFLYGYYGTSLAALAAIAQVGPAIVDGALMMAGTRGGNRLGPCPTAGGPHSTFKANPAGRTSGYATWEPNSRNPTGWDLAKRVDTQYANPHSHGGVGTPHVHEPGGTRPALAGELPP